MTIRTIDFSKFSSIKIGPVANVAVLQRGDIPLKDHTLIGHANNLLISPTPPLLMMLGKTFDKIEIVQGELHIGAATPTGKILSFCKKHDISGFEYVAKLPGTLGGMLAMNAGVKAYETFDNLLKIATDKGVFHKSQITHGYRYASLNGIAYEAVFEIKQGFNHDLLSSLLSLRSNQPKLPSAGSVFKNPPNNYAGRLIEAVGLKGKQVGNMALSDQHANFLVNMGGGTYQEAIKLIKEARARVFDEFGIEMEMEIKIINQTH